MKPICFSAPMVRAILEGRKSQTRRVVTLRLPQNYQVGMRLWVRESFALWREGWDRTRHVVYRADMRDKAGNDATDWIGLSAWKRSIHMPRWASRITLELTDVRVQRVQEISDADALAEGVEIPADNSTSPRDVFKALWDATSARRECGWDANPLVRALTFRRVEGKA